MAQVTFNAGGITGYGPALFLSNVHFLSNSSNSDGGALLIRNFGGEGPSFPQAVRIEGCLFSGNAAVEGDSSCIDHGATFSATESDLIITNTTFSSNQGLAIRSLAGTLSLTQCTFYDNPSGAFDASDDIEFPPGSSVSLNNSLVLDSYLATTITSNGTNFLADGSNHDWGSVLFQHNGFCS